MKKAFLISLCVLALSASAQNTALKVQSNGNIAIQTNSTVVSPITINGAGVQDYYMYCNSGEKSGLYIRATGKGYGTNFGCKSHAENADLSIGVIGDAGSASTVNSIGILGCIGNTDTGAGIYGTTIRTAWGHGISTGEKYAGFFRGNVKVTGILDATLLGESSSSSGSSGSGLSL